MTPAETRLEMLRKRMWHIYETYPDIVGLWLARWVIDINTATEEELERVEKKVSG